MKRLILGLVVGLLIGSAATAVAASDTVTATITKLRFIVNGEERDVQTEQLVIMGTTYLPVREVANMLGYDVVYRADSRTVEFVGPVTPKTVKHTDLETQPEGEERNMIGTLMVAHQLLDLLAEKYPAMQYPQIYLTQDGELKFGDDHFKLTVRDNIYLDITPLIEAGILGDEDIQ